MTTTTFLHCPELMAKSINNSVLGDGSETDVVQVLDNQNFNDTDHHNIVLNSQNVFYELTFYFTENGIVIPKNDFCIVLDVEKESDKIY